MKTRALQTRIIMVIAAIAVVAWTLYRAGRSPRPETVDSATGPGQEVTSAPAATVASGESTQRWLVRRASADPSDQTTPAVVEDPALERLAAVPPGKLEEIRRQRAELHGELVAGNDAVVGEVEQILKAAGVSDPAPAAVGSAWRLVQSWRVFARSEAEAESTIEDRQLREELGRARRTILLETAQQELEALLDGRSGTVLLSELEQKGRELAAAGDMDAATRARFSGPEVPKAPRVRRVELDPE